MQIDPSRPGLFRTALCHRPARMREVFDALKARFPIPLDQDRAVPFAAKVPLAGGAQHEGWELIEFPGKAYLALCDCTFPQDRVEWVSGEGLTEFHFALSGPVSVSRGDAQTDAGGLSVLIFRVGSDASYQVICRAGPRRSLGLYVYDSYLDTLLSDPDAPLNDLRQELQSVGPEDVYLRRIPVNRALAGLIEQILSTPYGGQRRLVYAEAKCMELLCETLDVWRANQTSTAERHAFRPKDLELFERAGQHILANLAEVPNIQELARLLGTNVSKLTAGFRLLFGTSIQQFTVNAKMERALTMLIQERAAIGQVAAELGYQHQSSFTLAFKRHFGFPPSRAPDMTSALKAPNS